MNAGAHGGEMSNIIACVDLVLASGEKQRLPAKELEFSYRHSVMPEGSIVIGAEIKLIPGVAAEISERRQNFLNDRKKNQPLTLPSCGSVFKNPFGSARAGELIEQCGLKGTRRGGAQISEKHGNWIVTPERQAKTADVLELIALCQTTVKSKTRIDLEREVRDLV